MNGAQLSAWFEANKKTVLAVGAAGAVGLGLLKARSAGTRPVGDPPTGGPAAMSAVGSPVPVAGYAAYDSSGSDLYNAMQPLAEAVGRLTEQNASPIPVPVEPMAATLSMPSYSGKLVRYGDGGLVEVQNDGSMFGLTLGQYNDAVDRGRASGNLQWTQLEGNSPTAGIFSTEANLAAMAKRNAGAA